MTNIILNNKKALKKLKTYLIIGLLSASTMGCGKSNKKTDSSTTITPIEVTKEITPTEKVTPVPTTEVAIPTESTKKGELDITDNFSIETAVEKSYNDYESFYNAEGISKDQVRDLVFVLNDVYVDKDGNLIINEDRVHEAYSNIKDILYSDEMIKMIGIIDEKEAGIDVKRDFTIDEHPSLSNLVDINITGGAATASKIADYEKIRDAEILKMNTEKKYNKEIVNEYVINNSVNDVNKNNDHMDNISKNGQKYVIAATKFYGLQMAASMNSQTEFIKVNKDGVSDIKINPNEKERKMIADYYQYADEGMDIPESLAKEYVEYLNKKLDTGYFRVMCDEEAESVSDVNEIKNSLTGLNTYTLNK